MTVANNSCCGCGDLQDGGKGDQKKINYLGNIHITLSFNFILIKFYNSENPAKSTDIFNLKKRLLM